MKTYPATLLIAGKERNYPISLAGGRLCKASQDCAGVQLIQHQQRATLEQKRFESVVSNGEFSTTLKGK